VEGRLETMMQTVEQKTYRTMRQKLMTGAWQPGHQLSALAIAKQIGVSPTPVTQAIRRLETEGFVEVVPHLGAFVRRPKARELAEFFDIRRALELFAVRRATRIATEADLARLDGLIHDWERSTAGRAGGNEQDGKLIAQAVESDLFFHVVILEIAGSRRAMQIFRDCHLLTRQVDAPHYVADAGALAVEAADLAEHRAVLDAMRRRKPAEAAKTLDKNLRAGKTRLLSWVKSREGVADDAPGEPPAWAADVWAALGRVESYRPKRRAKNQSGA
jgi:DNA-binding GntR family transcriptional regulator